MSGRSAQAKGRRGEIELARYLQEKGFTDAQPGAPLNYGKEADITGISGLHIECKRHERLEINKWYEQAAADAERETRCYIPAEPAAMDDSIIFRGFFRTKGRCNGWQRRTLKPLATRKS